VTVFGGYNGTPATGGVRLVLHVFRGDGHRCLVRAKPSFNYLAGGLLAATSMKLDPS